MKKNKVHKEPNPSKYEKYLGKWLFCPLQKDKVIHEIIDIGLMTLDNARNTISGRAGNMNYFIYDPPYYKFMYSYPQKECSCKAVKRRIRRGEYYLFDSEEDLKQSYVYKMYLLSKVK